MAISGSCKKAKVSRTSQEASDVKRGDWNLWNLMHWALFPLLRVGLIHLGVLWSLFIAVFTGLCVDSEVSSESEENGSEVSSESEENDSEVSSEILPGLVPPVRLLEVDGVDRTGADAIKTSRTTALFLSVLDPFMASEASEAAALDPFLSQPL
jgi:hypothetical protein